MCIRAMFQELLEERRGLCAARSRGARTAHPGRRQGALHGVRRVVIELVVFFRRAAPVEDIGLVPQFPTPLLHFRLAIARHRMPVSYTHLTLPTILRV